MLMIMCIFYIFCKTEYVQAATDFTSVHAGDWVTEENVRTVNGTKFKLKDTGGFFRSRKKLYATRNNKTWLLASSDGVKDDLCNRIFTDGKTVYYVKKTYRNSLDGTRRLANRFKIYRVKLGKKSKLLDSVKARNVAADSDFGILGIESGRIYFEDWNKVYCYSLKSKKYEEMNLEANSSNGKARQYKHYIFIWNWRYSNVGTLDIINAKKKKVVKTINKVNGTVNRAQSKRNGIYDIISGKLYYLEFKKEGGYDSFAGSYDYAAVKRCNLDGSKDVTLVKKITVAEAKPVILKKHSITYYDGRGKKRTKKF